MIFILHRVSSKPSDSMVDVVNNVDAFAAMAILAFFTGLVIIAVTAYKNKFYLSDVRKSIFISVLPIIMGGKVLYYLTSGNSVISFESIFFESGFVFYGGLIGAIIGFLISSEILKINYNDLLCCFASAIPVMQSIGRIGCYFNGCCYGKEYYGLGAIPHGDIMVFPTQFTESILCALLAIILITIEFRYRFAVYCFSYGAIRFAIEFLRGDEIRGGWLFLSTSQWISIGFIVLGIYLINRLKSSNQCKESIDNLIDTKD